MPPPQIFQVVSEDFLDVWRIFYYESLDVPTLGGGFKWFFNFHPYLGKWSNLTNMFQMGWNHHLQQMFAIFPYHYPYISRCCPSLPLEKNSRCSSAATVSALLASNVWNLRVTKDQDVWSTTARRSQATKRVFIGFLERTVNCFSWMLLEVLVRTVGWDTIQDCFCSMVVQYPSHPSIVCIYLHLPSNSTNCR